MGFRFNKIELKRPSALRWRIDYYQLTDFAGLSANYFSPCFSLCLLDLILSQPLFDLIFDGNGRRKFDFRPNRCVRIGRS